MVGITGYWEWTGLVYEAMERYRGKRDRGQASVARGARQAHYFCALAVCIIFFRQFTKVTQIRSQIVRANAHL